MSCAALPPPVWREVGAGLFACEIILPDVTVPARLIPSLAVLLPAPCGFRFALHENGGWRSLDAVGERDISLAEIAEGLAVAVEDISEDSNLDFFDLPHSKPSSRRRPGSIPEPLHLALFLKVSDVLPLNLQLVLVLTAIVSSDPRWLPACAEMTAERLAVSPISQREQNPAIAPHICSPVSTLMVARYLARREIPLEPFVAAAYSERRRMYGIWPRAMMAATWEGVAGMVTALANWQEVAALLQAGLPVIASIAYQADELAGAAVPATRGHLVVISGLTETTVIVNDPAASTAAEVRRDYDLAEFAEAWFGNKRGVCYVLWLGDE